MAEYNRDRHRRRNRRHNSEIFQGAKACKAIIRKLFSSEYKPLAWVFYDPIEAAFLGLHDYHTIVQKPMHLRYIRNRLNKGDYTNAEDFERDVRQIFNNTYLYTPPNHVCHQMAKKLEGIFDKMFLEISATLKSDTTSAYAMSPFTESAEGMREAIPNSLTPLEAEWKSEDDKRPWSKKANKKLAKRLRKLRGEVLLRVMHIIKYMEKLPIVKRELNFDMAALQSVTKRTIVSYLSEMGGYT
ncbi:bromodomain-containing protein 2 [Drosophila guanche]|uniref:Blast:Homeotic protein female sterile n=1 Tax=Drosophila guanche TaxID=7266 RepID=A0A3B0IZL9_DROGU|nr:bromodomain-containing protein 2 [Drosophila guanche]SPP73557.1 blast:Homeotic protein female sterile [Drosophila guanche]